MNHTATVSQGFLQARQLSTPGYRPEPSAASPASEGFAWCVVCERTFRPDRQHAGEACLCPYPGCDGGVLFEPWAWSKLVQMNPRYPAVPLEDVTYPFFGGMEAGP